MRIAFTMKSLVVKKICTFRKQAMKLSTIGIFFVLLIFIVCTSTITDAQCWGNGYGGCNDAGCGVQGGYCQNFARPPYNDCRCVGHKSRHRHRRPHHRYHG